MVARGENSVAEKLYSILLRLYPPSFRAEYGEEMLRAFTEWRSGSGLGACAATRFWFAAIIDLTRSISRQWFDTLTTPLQEDQVTYRPSYLTAAAAGITVFLLYLITLAPTTAFWDAGEYMTVAHIMGIPHSPGSPLFVLLAHGWEILLAPLGFDPGIAVNLFGATLSAASHALWFLVVERVLAAWKSRCHRVIGSTAAVAFSATAFTVWNQSNVVEKNYVIALFTTALVTWLALRWRDGQRPPRTLVLIAFIVALSSTNHLMGVLVAPALIVFIFLTDKRVFLRPRLYAAVLAVIVVATSVQFFLPIRAAQRPIVAEGSSECTTVPGAVLSVYTWGRAGCEPLSSVLTREQYGKPSILLDPTVYPQQAIPRDAELLASQFVNYFQYFDWQWGRSIDGGDPLFGGTRPIVSLAFLLLGVYGARIHWRKDRESAALFGILFITLSVGLVIYLNFRYGYSIGPAPYPVSEVRERDYFFLIGFSVWGLWSGIGLTGLWRNMADRLSGIVRWSRLAATPILGLVLVPLALNWGWATRDHDYAARDWAYNVLMSVEPYGVLVTNGDNDTFPLWYVQEVEGLRQDVTVMVSAYMNTPWYVKQIRELTEPCAPGVIPAVNPTRIICQRPFQAGDLPGPLLEVGWALGVEPPSDSIVPLTDAEINQYASTYFVVEEPLTMTAGDIEAEVAPGTALRSADLVTASILQATMGERPIHFMPGSPIVERLGLSDYTVRQGVTWKIHNGSIPLSRDEELVTFGESRFPLSGAAIDLALTDTLVWEVYLRRGRILDPEAPWVDAATANILGQYVYTHFAAAQAHALRGEERAIGRHVRQAEWWEEVSAN